MERLGTRTTMMLISQTDSNSDNFQLERKCKVVIFNLVKMGQNSGGGQSDRCNLCKLILRKMMPLLRGPTSVLVFYPPTAVMLIVVSLRNSVWG